MSTSPSTAFAASKDRSKTAPARNPCIGKFIGIDEPSRVTGQRLLLIAFCPTSEGVCGPTAVVTVPLQKINRLLVERDEPRRSVCSSDRPPTQAHRCAPSQ